MSDLASIHPMAPGTDAEQLDAATVHARLTAVLVRMERAQCLAALWFAEVVRRGLHQKLGYSTIETYATEGLGFSRSTAFQFLRLARRLPELPELRRALAAGEIGWTKALIVAHVATKTTDREWVELAARHSRRELVRAIAVARAASRAAAARRVGNGGAGNGGAGREESRGGISGRVPGDGPTMPGNRVASAAPGGPGAPGAGAAAGGSQSRAPSAAAPDLQVVAVPLPPNDHPSATQALLDLSPEDPTEPRQLPETMVSVALRFTPLQEARFKSLLEAVRKRKPEVARLTREELVMAGLEELLAEEGGRRRRATGAAGQLEDQPSAQAAAQPFAQASARAAARRVESAERPNPSSTTRPECSRLHLAAGPPNARTPYRILVFRCQECGRAWVQSGGMRRPLSAASLAAVECDARTQDARGHEHAAVPPAVRRAVMNRDGYRCRMPGCGKTHFLEVHHLVPRSRGGGNEPDNLVTLCSSCHRFVHESGAAGLLPAASPALRGQLAATPMEGSREGAPRDKPGEEPPRGNPGREEPSDDPSPAGRQPEMTPLPG